MSNDVPLEASTSHVEADRIHAEPTPGNGAASGADDRALADRTMLNHMIRRPTEEDFDEVLTPEGNRSGDIVGSDVSDGIGVSNDSVGGI